MAVNKLLAKHTFSIFFGIASYYLYFGFSGLATAYMLGWFSNIFVNSRFLLIFVLDVLPGLFMGVLLGLIFRKISYGLTWVNSFMVVITVVLVACINNVLVLDFRYLLHLIIFLLSLFTITVVNRNRELKS